MYYDNNFYNIYILYGNNKFYFMRIANMKLSDKGNLYNSTESVNKIELTLIFISYIIYTALFINSSKHCSKIYDCENKKFIFYNMFGKIKKEISIDITKMKCNIKKYPINGYFKLKDKTTNIKVLVSSNIEYPKYGIIFM